MLDVSPFSVNNAGFKGLKKGVGVVETRAENDCINFSFDVAVGEVNSSALSLELGDFGKMESGIGV